MSYLSQLKSLVVDIMWSKDDSAKTIVPPEQRELWCGTPLLRQLKEDRTRNNYSKNHEQEQLPTTQEQLIKIGDTFIETLKAIPEDDKRFDWSSILWLLDSVTLEEDYHLGLRFAEDNGFGDKSWFYCYQGNKDTYLEDYNEKIKEYGDFSPFNACYIHDEIYDVFDHLKIEHSELGAWQAYLISIASTILPTFWHGTYLCRQMVFSEKHWEELKLIRSHAHQPSQLSVDVSPSVKIEGDEAIVSCCFWNDWSGLVRETVYITFQDGKACFLDKSSRETLIEYNCGFRL